MKEEPVVFRVFSGDSSRAAAFAALAALTFGAINAVEANAQTTDLRWGANTLATDVEVAGAVVGNSPSNTPVGIEERCGERGQIAPPIYGRNIELPQHMIEAMRSGVQTAILFFEYAQQAPWEETCNVVEYVLDLQLRAETAPYDIDFSRSSCPVWRREVRGNWVTGSVAQHERLIYRATTRFWVQNHADSSQGGRWSCRWHLERRR